MFFLLCKGKIVWACQKNNEKIWDHENICNLAFLVCISLEGPSLVSETKATLHDTPGADTGL